MCKGLICGVSGRARSGKNQLSKFIIEEFEKKYNRKFYEASFANELKYMCKFQFGLGDDQLWGNKKEVPDRRYLKPTNEWKDEVIETEFGHSSGTVINWTPREIMQELGAFYRKIDYDFWIKGLKKFLHNELLKGHRDFIITDVRYINEAEFIRNSKGILIRINRNIDNEIHGINHESETNLDSYKKFDIHINNDGNLDDLRKASCDMVDAISSMEKLINNRRII